MCGIAGYMDMRQERRVDEDILIKMSNRLIHRGPDSYGQFIDQNTALGMRRLAIIDLVSGDQPIYNEDESIVLICNGEIYNYQALRHQMKQKGHVFRTNCDVEVLVHLYEEKGAELLNDLNGQFAFAIYDKNRKRLFLARDHFGINPLYYTVADGVFIFASEIKAIVEHPLVERKVDLTGLDQILSFPGLVSPRTVFDNIKSLKSGHSIIIENQEVKTAEYWDLDYPLASETNGDKPESFYVEELSALLAQSVKYRLQADVPVGFYLSGGLDSSLIAAMIKRVSPELKRHSFSIGFTDREISESRYQHLMSSHVDSTHHETVFDWTEIADRLQQTVYHCECPVKESYNTCSLSLSASAKQTGITVILTGEGADELFAGYIGYRFDRSGIRNAQRKHDLDTVLEEELRERLWGNKDLFYEIDQHGFREVKTALYSAGANEMFEQFDCLNEELVNKARLRGRDPVHQRSYLDFKLRLADHLLSDHGDKMVLANSVEGRYPFLDVELVEFARSVPVDLKLNGFVEKYILKRVAEGSLPDKIIEREKFGFRAPGSPYLLQQNIPWVGDLLSYDRIKRQGYFNPDVVERLKSTYSQPGFKLHPHLEVDLLMVVLTFGILIDQFELGSLN